MPLEQILAVMIHRLEETAKYNKTDKSAKVSLENALEFVLAADRTLSARWQETAKAERLDGDDFRSYDNEEGAK